MNIRKWVLFGLVILWMLAVFNFSAQTREQSKELSNKVVDIVAKTFKIDVKVEENQETTSHIVRKLAHFTLYFVGGIITTMFVFTPFPNLLDKQKIRYTIYFGILYAISDEIHQYFVPGRGTQATDVYIDTTGFILGILVIVMFYLIKKHKNAQKI